MSSIINNFNIFLDFPPNIAQNVKTVYVINYYYGYCVTNDNKVYGLGNTIYKILDFNENIKNKKYKEICELRDKNIEEFYQGWNVMLARNEQNQIFRWGTNYHEQLEKSTEINNYWIPHKIDFFDDKNIITISCCGFSHFLCLSSDGMIYEFNQNSKQDEIPLRNYLNRDDFKLVKTILNTTYQINSFDLIALTFNEIVVEFNETSDQKIGYECKQLYDLNKIKELIEKHQNNKTIEEFVDLCLDGNELICQTTDNCVYIYQNSNVEKSSHKTLFEYFLFEYQKTYKTIHIKNNRIFVISFKRSDENSGHLVKQFKQIDSNHNNFNFKQDQINLRNFRITNDLQQILESNVKYYYQSGSISWKYIAFFVMNDNRVYCLGNNCYGMLGLGHNRKTYVYQEIVELFDQNIEEFFEGQYCMFARNERNQIFAWGRNEYGQLGRGHECTGYLKPEKIDYFDDKNILFISSGFNHCLALSANGQVYGWGDNSLGQVGCGKHLGSFVLTPLEIDLGKKVNFIYCARDLSCAVSIDGTAYYWGEIVYHYLVTFTPKLIPIENVAKFFNYYEYRGYYAVLKKEGNVFIFKALKEKIIEINCEEQIKDIYPDDYSILLQSYSNCVYKLNDEKNPKMIETNYINFYDFYSHKSRNYKKTFQITKEGYIMSKVIQFNEKMNILFLKDENAFNRKYENIFEEISEKGRGGFGTVFTVKKKSNNLLYAIKRMEIMDEFDFKEIKIMSVLNSCFVVQYIDSWIEVKVIFKKIRKFLFIQMELCSHNLRDFIDLMNKTFEEKFKIFNYFISCQLFRELIECVNYLHSIPIIHRDLKPENILISDGINGRFLKLCDFGLAKVHQNSVHTRMVGTIQYMAPEVLHSNQYNTKSDIYSLALIASEIFSFDDNIINIRNQINLSKYSTLYSNPRLKTKFNVLLKTLTNCLSKDFNSRPDSQQLINIMNEWTVDKSTLIDEENIISDFRQVLDKNEILKNFFETHLAKNLRQTNREKQNSLILLSITEIIRNNFNIFLILFVIILSFIINLILF